MGAMRLAKYLAHAGVASRRASEELIREGRVTVDGVLVTDPALSVESQRVTVDGRQVTIRDEREVWMVHKPEGVVSTASDTHGRAVVTAMVKTDRRLYPVGRLDQDSTGLLLLTDDGDLANRLIHPRYEVPKTYLATVEGGKPSPAALRMLREGVVLDDGMTAPAQVRERSHGVLEITLREGRKRQVRRMCEAVGHPVKALHRESFGPLRLGDLGAGKVRKLTAAEIERLRSAAKQ